MVKINGKKIDISDTDDLTTILEVISADMNTLPKYLYFPKGIPSLDILHNKSNIEVYDILSIITDKKYGTDFIKLFNKVNNMLKQQKLKIKDDILIPFIAYNDRLNKLNIDLVPSTILLTQTSINESNIFSKPYPDIEKIWEGKNTTIKTINDKIKDIQIRVQNAKKIDKQLKKIEEKIPYTPIEITGIDFNCKIPELQNMNIMDIFNMVKLNCNTPLSSNKNFYKILKDFIPPEDWSVSLEDFILFKVLQKKENVNVKVSDYTDIFLNVTGEKDVKVYFSLDISTKNLDKDGLVNRFTDIIEYTPSITYTDIEETMIKSVFYIPNHDFNKFIFSDLALNNKLFSSLLYIDESSKTNVTKNKVYIHFQNNVTGEIKANISGKTVVKNDPNIKGKRTEFNIGSNYIKVKIIKAKNILAVEKFQRIFARLIGLYDMEYNDILSVYRKYITRFWHCKESKGCNQVYTV